MGHLFSGPNVMKCWMSWLMSVLSPNPMTDPSPLIFPMSNKSTSSSRFLGAAMKPSSPSVFLKSGPYIFQKSPVLTRCSSGVEFWRLCASLFGRNLLSYSTDLEDPFVFLVVAEDLALWVVFCRTWPGLKAKR